MWSGGGRTRGAGILACRGRLQAVRRGPEVRAQGHRTLLKGLLNTVAERGLASTPLLLLQRTYSVLVLPENQNVLVGQVVELLFELIAG